MTEIIKIPATSGRDFAQLKMLSRMLKPAADALREGALVAFPTETVYGLGANALDPEAVARIFEVKGRPVTDPLIVHLLGMEDAGPLVTRIPASARRLAEAFWPGPLTLILPSTPSIPSVVTAGLDSVALRAPSHEVARALLALAKVPVAAPSANPFGRTSPTTAAHVLADLDGKVDFVVDGGPAELGVESTVVDCRGDRPKVLRPGGVSIEALRGVVGEVELPADVSALGNAKVRTASAGSPTSEDLDPGAKAQRSPGMLLRHYAPMARVVLLIGEDQDATASAMALAERSLLDQGRSVALLLATEDLARLDPDANPDRTIRRVLADRGDATQAASVLFASLREADEAGAELIIARDFGTRGLGLAVRDRLWRAAEGRALRVMPADVDGTVERILGALIGG
jgi:L-threonylcarbamoyladenylate synthase